MIAIFSLLLFGGCAHDHAHDHGEHAEPEKSGVNEDEVHLLQKQMEVMKIELGNFQYLNLSTTVKSNGQLELPPQNQASLSAVLGGRVKSIDVLEGDYVRKGETMATLENPEFVELQEEYLTAISEFEFLEIEYERHAKLYEDKVIAQQEFQQAKANYFPAMARLEGVKTQLTLLNVDLKTIESGKFMPALPVKAPINGFVRQVEINMGKFVQPEQELFEIVDNEHIHIDLMVYERDISKIANGQKVIFSLTTNPDSLFQGSIFAVGKSFEQEPKAVVVHAEIDNKSGNLFPGMYVDARIVTNTDSVMALPNDAIVRDGGLDYIFVLQTKNEYVHNGEDIHDHGDEDAHKHENSDGHAHDDDGNHAEESHKNEFIFKKVEVNTGATDIGFVETVPVDQLLPGTKVVTSGAYYLLAEMKKGSGGHGHHH